MNRKAVDRLMYLGQIKELLITMEINPEAIKNPHTRCKSLLNRAAALDIDEETNEDTDEMLPEEPR